MISKIHFIFIIYRFLFCNSCTHFKLFLRIKPLSCHAWSARLFFKSFQKNSFKNSFNTSCKYLLQYNSSNEHENSNLYYCSPTTRIAAKLPILQCLQKKPLSTRKNRRAGPKTSLVPAAL